MGKRDAADLEDRDVQDESGISLEGSEAFDNVSRTAEPTV